MADLQFIIKSDSPAKDDLIFWTVVGQETLLRPTIYELTVLSTNEKIDAKDILGHAFDVVIEFFDADDGKHERHCQGHAVRFMRRGTVGRFFEYRITLRTWFWLLTKRTRTRSTPKGSAANCNEFRFDDKKGSEQVYLRAEKKQDIEVESDETHSVGHDRTKTIDHDETTQVKHDRTETVDNNATIAVHDNQLKTLDATRALRRPVMQRRVARPHGDRPARPAHRLAGNADARGRRCGPTDRQAICATRPSRCPHRGWPTRTAGQRRSTQAPAPTANDAAYWLDV